MPLQSKSSNGALIAFDSGPNIGKLMNDCCCAVDCALLEDCYQLDGYVDGDFVINPAGPVTTCAASGLPTAVFDGTFSKSDDGCIWQNSALDPFFSLCISGYFTANGPGAVYLEFTQPDIWTMTINVVGSANSWLKVGGNTPIGTYIHQNVYDPNYILLGPETFDLIDC